MAALYLHNALFTPEHASAQSGVPHLRTLSNSTVTTSTITTGTTHATGGRPLSSDDLLPSPHPSHSHSHHSHSPINPYSTAAGSTSAPGSAPPARRERYPTTTPVVAFDSADEEDGEGEGGDTSGNGTWRTEPLNLVGDPPTAEELNQHRAMLRQRKLQRWKVARFVVTVVVFGWGVYCAVRYFLSFAVYNTDPYNADATRRALALSFGTTSSLSALLIATLPFQRFINIHTLSSPLLRTYFALSPILSSFCLIAPATANLVLTALWHGACGGFEIDVLWPPLPPPPSFTSPIVNRDGCVADDATWGAWLAGAIARFVLTFCFLTLWHATLIETRTIPSPVWPTALHRRSEQAATPLQAPTSPQSPTSRPYSPYSPHSPRSPRSSQRPPLPGQHRSNSSPRMSERHALVPVSQSQGQGQGQSQRQGQGGQGRTRYPDPETSSTSSSSSSSMSEATSPFSATESSDPHTSSSPHASSSRHPHHPHASSSRHPHSRPDPSASSSRQPTSSLLPGKKRRRTPSPGQQAHGQHPPSAFRLSQDSTSSGASGSGERQQRYTYVYPTPATTSSQNGQAAAAAARRQSQGYDYPVASGSGGNGGGGGWNGNGGGSNGNGGGRPPSANDPAADARLRLWADDFRSLMEQINRETEAGMQLARTDPSRPPTASTSSASAYPSNAVILNDEYTYSDTSPAHSPTTSGRTTPSHLTSANPNNAFAVPRVRRPETVRILGSYVRRMSTIESFGSREIPGAGSGTSGDERTTVVGGSRGGSVRSVVVGTPSGPGSVRSGAGGGARNSCGAPPGTASTSASAPPGTGSSSGGGGLPGTASSGGTGGWGTSPGSAGSMSSGGGALSSSRSGTGESQWFDAPEG